MTRETATLATGQLLTLATGRLACDISEVYSAITLTTGINPMTHQIGRIMTELKPGLLRARPWLENVTPPDPNTDNIEQATLTWVSEVTAEHGDTHIVPLLSDQVTHQDPLTELRDMVGEDTTTTVVLAPATKSEFIPITPTDGPDAPPYGTCGYAHQDTTGQVTACGDPATWHVALTDRDESVATCTEHLPFAARGCDDWHHYGPDCAHPFTAWRYGTGPGTGHCEPATDTK